MRKPNVIVFFTDQQRFDTTGLHGNPMGLTPNFDLYGRQGTHLFNSISCQPLCGPARSCMQTGLYATQTGCWRNHIPLSTDTETLAHHFNKGGYHTGYIGKWHLGSHDPVIESQRGGYKEWLGANLLEFSSDAYDTLLWNNDNQRVKLPGYRVDALTDAAIRFIDMNKERPFFLFMSFLEPHHQNHLDNYPPPVGRGVNTNQWVPPDLLKFGGSYAQHLGGYYGMVRRLDEAFGRMMDALISLGLIDNTIVLFTSDHGCHFKTRNSEYKRSCHESSVRLPTILTGPGFFSGGEIRNLFSTIDVAPTLLDAAGLDKPSRMVGRSILPVIRDKSASWRDDLFIQISESQTGRALRTLRWKYAVTAPYDHDRQSSETYAEDALYDLDNDPYELVNLVGMAPFRQVADKLKSRLLANIQHIEGETPFIIDAPTRDPLQLMPNKGADVAASRLAIDPYKSPLLDITEEFAKR